EQLVEIRGAVLHALDQLLFLGDSGAIGVDRIRQTALRRAVEEPRRRGEHQLELLDTAVAAQDRFVRGAELVARAQHVLVDGAIEAAELAEGAVEVRVIFGIQALRLLPEPGERAPEKDDQTADHEAVRASAPWRRLSIPRGIVAPCGSHRAQVNGTSG